LSGIWTSFGSIGVEGRVEPDDKQSTEANSRKESKAKTTSCIFIFVVVFLVSRVWQRKKIIEKHGRGREEGLNRETIKENE